MALNRAALTHCKAKNLSASTTVANTLTAGGTTEFISAAFDLHDAAQQAGKFTYAKVIVPFVKTGSAAVKVQVTLKHCTTTGGSYTTYAGPTPATTALCVDAGHGYVATAGVAIVELDADLLNADEFLKVYVDATFTAANTDAVILAPVLVLGGAVEAPTTNTAMLTTG